MTAHFASAERAARSRTGFVGAALAVSTVACAAQEPEPPAELPVGDTVAMQLGAVTHFSQGWGSDALPQAAVLEPGALRDGLRWEQVEREPGAYVFEKWRNTYPDTVSEEGLDLTVTLLGSNPLYDEGDTVHSADAVAAFGAFAAAVAARFPVIQTIEVGNEINGENFLFGALKDADYPRRIELYVALLSSVHDRVKAASPETRIAGGGVHSIPVSFVEQLFQAGAGDYMDALVLHPYTTAPELIEKEIGYLRTRLPDPDFPIDVTEFGRSESEGAPGYLLKMSVAMAAAGVEHAQWYALRRLGGMRTEPLIDEDGEPTPTGRAFAVARRHVLSHPVSNVSPDAYAYAYQAGERMLVLWGEPREIAYPTGGVTAYTPEGERLETLPAALDMETPILLTANRPIALGRDVVLGPAEILADSYHDYSLVPDRSQDAFDRFFRRGGTEIALSVMGGGDRKSALWIPHLASPFHRPMFLHSEGLSPGAFGAPEEGGSTIQVVHRFIADREMSVAARTMLAPRPRSIDGVRLSITLNGVNISDEVVTEPVDHTTPPLALAPGDMIEIIVGPNQNSRGDASGYRFQILSR